MGSSSFEVVSIASAEKGEATYRSLSGTAETETVTPVSSSLRILAMTFLSAVVAARVPTAVEVNTTGVVSAVK